MGIAVPAHEGPTALVVLNAGRLLRSKMGSMGINRQKIRPLHMRESECLHIKENKAPRV